MPGADARGSSSSPDDVAGAAIPSAVPVAVPSAGPGRAPGFRPELQALRAVAVAAVVVYHARPGWLPGGFVGVDVFFALSGFLMGSLLLREQEETGRLRLGAFWARRARRLLPAALLTLAATAVAVLTLAPLGMRAGWLQEVAASAGYVQNWLLADRAVDYLHTDDLVSPLQHFWSLSVEEQFYVGLPLLLAVLACGRRRGAGGVAVGPEAPGPVARRRRTAAVLLALTLASLAWSWAQTRHDPGVAYFSTLTRAWELLAGSLLALAVHRARIPGRTVRLLLGWVAVALLAVALVTIDAGTPFPGLAALLPVSAALAAILAGDAGPLALLSRARPVAPPVVWLGDISYGLYLWHWPPLALLPVLLARPLTGPETAGVVLGAVLVAWASTRLVEDPIRRGLRRRGPRPAAGPRPVRVALASTVAMALVAGFALAGAAHAREERERLGRIADRVAATPRLERCLGAHSVAARPGTCADLGSLLVPDPAAAQDDRFDSADCWAGTGEGTPRVCSPGVEDGRTRVLVVGDSHVLMWYGALVDLARDRGWHLDIAAHSLCSWTARPPEGADVAATSCGEWRTRLSAWVADQAPYDLVVTGSARDSRLSRRQGSETVGRAATEAFREAWRPLLQQGARVAVLADVPRMRDDVAACVAKYRLAATATCARPRTEALAGRDRPVEAARGVPGVGVVDVNDTLCDTRRCAPVVGHVVAYQDPAHLSATYVQTLTDLLGRRLDAALG